jgi:hypothetical protein
MLSLNDIKINDYVYDLHKKFSNITEDLYLKLLKKEMIKDNFRNLYLENLDCKKFIENSLKDIFEKEKNRDKYVKNGKIFDIENFSNKIKFENKEINLNFEINYIDLFTYEIINISCNQDFIKEYDKKLQIKNKKFYYIKDEMSYKLYQDSCSAREKFANETFKVVNSKNFDLIELDIEEIKSIKKISIMATKNSLENSIKLLKQSIKEMYNIDDVDVCVIDTYADDDYRDSTLYGDDYDRYELSAVVEEGKKEKYEKHHIFKD